MTETPIPESSVLEPSASQIPEPRHEPVLLEETLRYLNPERGGWFVDCTLGLGGHAEALLERFPEAQLVGIDRDPQALALAGKRLERFGDRFRPARGRFSEIEDLIGELGIDRINGGIYADLGVSSMQLDLGERGFSLQHDGPLDMRMAQDDETDDEDEELTALEILHTYPEQDLKRILREYGEEPKAARIAKAIVEQREAAPIRTTGDLKDLIERVKPRTYPRRRKGRGKKLIGGKSIHPATQTFQALRIEVNQELRELETLLGGAINLLEQEGNLVVISYHSLEDRIVKHTLRDLAAGRIEPITGRPLAETQLIEVLTRKPVRPSEAETTNNPRSRSALLRAAKRI